MTKNDEKDQKRQRNPLKALTVVITLEVQNSGQRWWRSSLASRNSGKLVFGSKKVLVIDYTIYLWNRSDVLRTAESDSDNKEEYEIKRNKFGAPTYGLKPAAYMNCNGPAERSLALQTVINPLRKISVWKKAVSFLGSLPMQLQHVDWKPDYKGCYTNEEEAKG
ncbi:hypothetical protein Tco_1148509 [Tanacetum coccineum]